MISSNSSTVQIKLFSFIKSASFVFCNTHSQSVDIILLVLVILAAYFFVSVMAALTTEVPWGNWNVPFNFSLQSMKDHTVFWLTVLEHVIILLPHCF